MTVQYQSKVWTLYFFYYFLHCCHDFYRSRSLSLFRRCSAVAVTGLLAIIDQFFIFHWFCLVFLHSWFQSHSLPVVYLTLCFPSCICQRLFVCSVLCCLYWSATGPRTHFVLLLFSVGVRFHLLLLNNSISFSLILLHLTSLPPVHTTLTIVE